MRQAAEVVVLARIRLPETRRRRRRLRLTLKATIDGSFGCSNTNRYQRRRHVLTDFLASSYCREQVDKIITQCVVNLCGGVNMARIICQCIRTRALMRQSWCG